MVYIDTPLWDPGEGGSNDMTRFSLLHYYNKVLDMIWAIRGNTYFNIWWCYVITIVKLQFILNLHCIAWSPIIYYMYLLTSVYLFWIVNSETFYDPCFKKVKRIKFFRLVYTLQILEKFLEMYGFINMPTQESVKNGTVGSKSIECDNLHFLKAL